MRGVLAVAITYAPSCPEDLNTLPPSRKSFKPLWDLSKATREFRTKDLEYPSNYDGMRRYIHLSPGKIHLGWMGSQSLTYENWVSHKPMALL